ncbi:hypothetical protein SALBM311S_05065 [Streptomyces alboniger]
MPAACPTWAEVEADAKKIKQAGYIGLGLPLGPEEAQAEFQIWAMNNGGGWTDPSGKWAIDQQANVDTLSYLRKLTKEKVTQPNPEATNRKDVFNQFAQGKIGMLNGAVFMRKGFIDPVNAKLNYGVAALPSKDGSTHKTLGVQDYLVAFKKSDGSNKAAVKKFLDFFYQKENAAKFVSTEGFLSVTDSAGAVLSSDSKNAAYYKPFVDALSSAEVRPHRRPGVGRGRRCGEAGSASARGWPAATRRRSWARSRRPRRRATDFGGRTRCHRKRHRGRTPGPGRRLRRPRRAAVAGSGARSSPCCGSVPRPSSS